MSIFKLPSVFRAFRRDQRGNIAILFALSLIPLIGMVGAAVDYTRVTQVHTKLGDALDAAILAAGSRPAMTDAELYDFVKSWMGVHMKDTLASGWTLDSVTQNKGNIVGRASADVDMTISRILGISEHTSEKHLLSAKMKLGAANRTHAVAEAIRQGYIT